MPKTRGLTAKQQRFVDEYLVDLNATQAAIRAGYSERTAAHIGSELLTKPGVADAIAAAQAARQERTVITADAVLKRLFAIAFVDVNEIVEFRREPCGECWQPLDGNPQPPTEPNQECNSCNGEGVGRAFFKDTRKLSEAARALYGGVKVTKDGLEVKMGDRDKALELLGKHLGIFVERHELTGKGGAPLPTATINLTPEQLRDAVVSALEKV